MGIFSASDIFEFAVRIEQNGEQFYRAAAKSVDDKETKEIFNYLADEEISHKKTFEDMLGNIDKYESPESYPGEYLTYLKTLIDKVVFSEKVVQSDSALTKNARSAINFAVERELESILYYHEIKRFVPQSQEKSIEKIIDEERRHYLKLLDLKKGYAGKEA